MLETEAKTKACPLFSSACIVACVGTGVDAAKTFQEATKCIGSACMMWKWSLAGPVQDRTFPLPSGARSSVDGYCGLAGGQHS